MTFWQALVTYWKLGRHTTKTIEKYNGVWTAHAGLPEGGQQEDEEASK